MNTPKVAIVLLNYNQAQGTSRCLESLKHLAYPSFEVLVVDNGSREDPEMKLKDRFPTVHWMGLRENIGFAAGCNQGIRWGLSRGAEAILLLNNDAVTQPDFLAKMVETSSEGPAVGVVGAVIYRAEDPIRPFLSGMRFDFLRTKVVRCLPTQEGKEVPCVSGACFLIQKECLEKVGLLDERFFIYFEETDFCYRARKRGFRVLYDPRVSLQHEEGATFGRESAATRYFYTRNRLLFISKHASLWIRPWTFAMRMAKDLALLFLFLLKGEKEISKAILYGLLDYGSGRFGKGRLNTFFHG
ncbi:MAG: glycosyltransferase family 2 protein [Candidatus Omnitrophica bacterium]|nr:glycosyltransferase family 2 protein [Candidatus Omnitrophota bacterium]